MTIDDIAKRLKLGATGEYPEGHLNKDDEGQLRMAISSSETHVRIDFGKPVAWFVFTKQGAREFAAALLKQAEDKATE